MAEHVHAVREALEATHLLPADSPDRDVPANYRATWQVIHQLEARGWTISRL